MGWMVGSHRGGPNPLWSGKESLAKDGRGAKRGQKVTGVQNKRTKQSAVRVERGRIKAS